jgi:hypothetical protein
MPAILSDPTHRALRLIGDLQCGRHSLNCADARRGLLVLGGIDL